MPFTIREFDAEDKFHRQVTLDAFAAVLHNDLISQALANAGCVTFRERKLNLVLVVWVIIAMGWFAECSIPRVFDKLVQGARLLLGRHKSDGPGASALAHRRWQIGVRPLADLCRQVCQPLAAPQTPGAFAFGLRLVAMDGTVDAVLDTPENVTVFGRAQGRRGPSAWAQVRGVHLVECGTHGMIGCSFWPYAASERRGAWRLLAQFRPDWLVMWDSGFHSYDWLQAVQAGGTQFLARCPATVKPEVVQVLPDGTRLVNLRPSDARLRRRQPALLVRLIEYRITDPAWSGQKHPFRLVTSLLDPERYPARALVQTYHQRWEFEVSLDEIETHQRLSAGVLRSRTPWAVMQELYGLVLSHYLIRALMTQAAAHSDCAPTQLSFVAAFELIRASLLEFQLAHPRLVPGLLGRLLRDLAAARLPARRTRIVNRVVRRGLSKFQRKRGQSRQPCQPARPWIDSIALI